MNNQKFIRCNKLFAAVWGLDVAVVMEQVIYWLRRNEKDRKNLRDGTVWFYGSIRELTEKYFPYWTPRQLQSLMDYMVSVGLLRVGRYNKMKCDRTKWYTVVDTRLLIEDDYVPPQKSVTKRRSISRPPLSVPLDPRVKDPDTDVRGSDPSVQGSDADVKSNSPSSGTYTTTKQHINETEKETEKEQLNLFIPSLRSGIEGGKTPPSTIFDHLFKEDNEDITTPQSTEGRTQVPDSVDASVPGEKDESSPGSHCIGGSVCPEHAAPPSRVHDAKFFRKMFDKLFADVDSAKTEGDSNDDIGRGL